MADLAIGAFILFGALAGFSKGVVVPLVAVGGGLVTLSSLYAGPFNGAVPAGAFGLGAGALALGIGGAFFARIGMGLVGLVHRFSLLRAMDRTLGVPVGMVTAAVTLYVALLATLAVDGWLDPLHGKTSVDLSEISALQTLAAANPTFAMFAEPGMLELLAQSAASAPVTTEQIANANAALSFYERTVRPELLQSRIAPLLLAVGEKLPFIGRPAAMPTE